MIFLRILLFFLIIKGNNSIPMDNTYTKNRGFTCLVNSYSNRNKFQIYLLIFIDSIGNLIQPEKIITIKAMIKPFSFELANKFTKPYFNEENKILLRAINGFGITLNQDYKFVLQNNTKEDNTRVDNIKYVSVPTMERVKMYKKKYKIDFNDKTRELMIGKHIFVLNDFDKPLSVKSKIKKVNAISRRPSWLLDCFEFKECDPNEIIIVDTQLTNIPLVKKSSDVIGFKKRILGNVVEEYNKFIDIVYKIKNGDLKIQIPPHIESKTEIVNSDYVQDSDEKSCLIK